MKQRATFAAVMLGLLALAGLALQPPPVAWSQTVFSTPLNNVASTLGENHLAGSPTPTLVVKAGEGSFFGSPTPTAPVRITVARKNTLVSGRIVPTSTYTIYDVTGRSGDTLTGATAVEGTTDRDYAKNDPIEQLITAGMLGKLHAAVNTLETTVATLPVDANVLHRSGDPETSISPKTLSASGASATPLVLKGASGQAADHLRVQRSDGNDLFKVDGDGTLRQYRASKATNLLQAIHPEQTDGNYPVTFNTSAGSISNVGAGGPAGSWDSVVGFGFNDSFGAEHVPGYPVFRDAWESRWYSAGQGRHQFERHVGAVRGPGSNVEVRPITIATSWTDFFTTELSMTANHWSVQDNPAGAPRQIFNILSDNAATPIITYEYLYPVGNKRAFGVSAQAGASTVYAGYSGVPTTVNVAGTNAAVALLNNDTERWRLQSFNGDPTLYVLAGTATTVATLTPGGNLTVSGPAAGTGTLTLTANAGAKLALFELGADGNFVIRNNNAGGITTNDYQAGLWARNANFSQVWVVDSAGGQTIAPDVASAVPMTLQGTTSQTGALLRLKGKSSTSAARDQGKVDAGWADSTDATRKGRVTIAASDASGTDREGVRVESDGTNPRTYLAAPPSAPAGAGLPNSTITTSVDEATNTLKFTVKYSNGTVKHASLPLVDCVLPLVLFGLRRKGASLRRIAA